MNNIHPHQANGEDFLMVEVPERSRNHAMLYGMVIFNIPNGKHVIVVELPSGTYTILGLGSELSEEQKAMVVEVQFDTFLDYQSPSVGGFIFDTAQGSLSSLCTSKGMQLKQTLFIKKEK